MGQWSLDFLRQNHVSSSWQVDGADHASQNNLTVTDVNLFFSIFMLKLSGLMQCNGLNFPANVVMFIFLKTLQNASDAEKTSFKMGDDARVGSLPTANKDSKDNLGNY